jgi:hypothetical protein
MEASVTPATMMASSLAHPPVTGCSNCARGTSDPGSAITIPPGARHPGRQAAGIFKAW